MSIEIVLAATCDVCATKRKCASIPIFRNRWNHTKAKICSYCLVELNTALLIPTPRGAKSKEKDAKRTV